jgi:hypothetical protein
MAWQYVERSERSADRYCAGPIVTPISGRETPVIVK